MNIPFLVSYGQHTMLMPTSVDLPYMCWVLGAQDFIQGIAKAVREAFRASGANKEEYGRLCKHYNFTESPNSNLDHSMSGENEYARQAACINFVRLDPICSLFLFAHHHSNKFALQHRRTNNALAHQCKSYSS